MTDIIYTCDSLRCVGHTGSSYKPVEKNPIKRGSMFYCPECGGLCIQKRKHSRVRVDHSKKIKKVAVYEY